MLVSFDDRDGDPDQSTQQWLVNVQPPISEIRGLQSGYGHSCGVDDGGYIHCRGGNDKGQLNGLPTGDGYTSVTMGAEAGCAVHRDGHIVLGHQRRGREPGANGSQLCGCGFMVVSGVCLDGSFRTAGETTSTFMYPRGRMEMGTWTSP